MANNQNLKPWKPGQSGNPAGKPKGTKHIGTLIREVLNDEGYVLEGYQNGELKRYRGAPLKAMIRVQITKAMNGDTKAFNSLMKYGWDSVPNPEKPPIQVNVTHTLKNVSDQVKNLEQKKD